MGVKLIKTSVWYSQTIETHCGHASRIDTPCTGSYFVVCGRACSCREDIDTPGNLRHIVGTAGHMIDMFTNRHFRVVDLFLIVPEFMTKCWLLVALLRSVISGERSDLI